MKNFIFICFLPFCFSNNGNTYCYKELKFGYHYAITKEYFLTIGLNSEFEFKFQQSDTRYKRRHVEVFKGVYENKGDTTILKLDNLASTKALTWEVFYLVKSDSIMILKPNIIFPNVMRIQNK